MRQIDLKSLALDAAESDLEAQIAVARRNYQRFGTESTHKELLRLMALKKKSPQELERWLYAAKDAYGYASHNVKKCPGTFYEGGCKGRGRPVPGYVYCAKCMRANEANESKAKDDREYPMPVHRLTGRNPDRCAQCGRPQSDLIHNCTNRFATDRRAKDQVPQDCFDAQILGV